MGDATKAIQQPCCRVSYVLKTLLHDIGGVDDGGGHHQGESFVQVLPGRSMQCTIFGNT